MKQATAHGAWGSESALSSKHAPLLVGALVWFALAYWLAASGALVNRPGERPIAVALTVFVPILLFLVALRNPSWRRLVGSVSPVFLIALSGWRFIGLGFIMGYDEGLLPGGFAWPAGLGDIAMAVTAPFVAARVAVDDRFRFGQQFLAWNVFGIADFSLAVFLGTLYNWPGVEASVSTGLMQRLPFALIPAFFVPLVAISHITLLAQRYEARMNSKAA
jgi:hypothetical protein